MEVHADAAPETAEAAVAFDAGPPTADQPEWLAAEQFSIELEQTTCYGTCPAFSVRVAESGHVSYRGTAWVARPGWYEVDIPPSDARRVFEAMIEAGFLRLHDRYVAEADGCSEVWTDGKTDTFTLRSGERMKQVVMYDGCVSPAEPFRARFQSEIRRATTIGRFLYPTPSARSGSSSDSAPRGYFARSWVLSDSPNLNRRDFGVLQIDADRHWTVADCDGQTLSSGDEEGAIGYDTALSPPKAAGTSFTWPGIEERQGVVLLNRSSLPDTITVRLLSLTEQYEQWAMAGTACHVR